jgi:flagellar assembly factor FliW
MMDNMKEMRIATTRFGEIDIADEKILNFLEGIPGFDRISRFALVSAEDTEPFHWLQSLDDAEPYRVAVTPALRALAAAVDAQT